MAVHADCWLVSSGQRLCLSAVASCGWVDGVVTWLRPRGSACIVSAKHGGLSCLPPFCHSTFSAQMATTFYNAAKLDQKGRQRLFDEVRLGLLFDQFFDISCWTPGRRSLRPVLISLRPCACMAAAFLNSPCRSQLPAHRNLLPGAIILPQINALPTVYELVSGRAQGVAAAEAKAARVVSSCLFWCCAWLLLLLLVLKLVLFCCCV